MLSFQSTTSAAWLLPVPTQKSMSSNVKLAPAVPAINIVKKTAAIAILPNFNRFIFLASFFKYIHSLITFLPFFTS
ncbi:MAG: hypothetical protein DRH43_06015 [Deltaproteobacteria bacterium]|nr:MAG: hypothetical protein DRH43_06015 [Deltaproteobacteria bacterium]